MKTKTSKCVCGATFQSASPNAKYCPSCSLVHKRIREKMVKRHGRGEQAKQAMREEFAKYLADLKSGKATAPEVEKVEPHHCPYCGHIVKTRAIYCPRCVRDGFHYVHRFTGRTTGWDKPQRRSAR